MNNLELLLEKQPKNTSHIKLDLKFIDLCSGIGSSRLALEQHGMECIGYSEIDKGAKRTYNALFNTSNEIDFGDLLNISSNDIPDIDFLIAGFPCQTFSIVGKRDGFRDKRGQLIFKINEILKLKQPKYFILENVKGLINLNNGFEYEQIKIMMNRVGYKVYSKVLNSYDYGIPQMRERIYFVGIRHDLECDDFYYPEPQKNHHDLSKYLINNDKDLILSGQPYKTFLSYLNNKYNQGKYKIDNLLKEDYLILDTRQSDLRIYKNKIPTLRTGRHGILYAKDNQLRRLSGQEALLLQGFPFELITNLDNSFSQTSLLSQAGNAMTVNVIYEIINSLKQIIVSNG